MGKLLHQKGAEGHPARHGSGGCHRAVPSDRWGAVRHRRRSRQDLARRSADWDDHDVRQWAAKEDRCPGGAIDVAFLGKTAYALVTLVGPDVGGNDVVGIYLVDGPDRFTVVADIGEFSLQNPPNTDFFVPTGISTPCKPTVAGSWSPMGTTTACCGSPSTARSPR